MPIAVALLALATLFRPTAIDALCAAVARLPIATPAVPVAATRDWLPKAMALVAPAATDAPLPIAIAPLEVLPVAPLTFAPLPIARAFCA
ncbi:hypothetical protein JCM10599A_65480 [Paraburkholderia kururiensis]|uniref:hypothetical protein n=1 Tax=Paraburkholderia kururiensis TaxID=984307 RepID=UPI001FC88341|nr:hypothetical protein [Paraburkholderia kururiensis]